MKQPDTMTPTDPSTAAVCMELELRRCCTCQNWFRPNTKNAPGSLIYCSARCGWSTEPGRSVDSLTRERDALKAALAQGQAQKNKCGP